MGSFAFTNETPRSSSHQSHPFNGHCPEQLTNEVGLWLKPVPGVLLTAMDILPSPCATTTVCTSLSSDPPFPRSSSPLPYLLFRVLLN
ncbi:MAG: hypothetical protein D6690_08855 [Nitrospirae bacterium]|nr:MAG: hypothetical protein D6690_08855 [Nitrospirota bacterium]